MSKLFFLLFLILLWGVLPSQADHDRFSSWLSGLNENFKNMQLRADRIRKEVETSLNKTFGTWDLLDFSLPFEEEKDLDFSLPFEPKGDYYWMKIRTDDGGHVKVKTVEKEPGKPEKIHVEEYDKGTEALKLEGEKEKTSMINEEKEKTEHLSPLKDITKEISELEYFNKYFSRVQEVADHIKETVESSLSKDFNTWNLSDYSFPMDPEKSYVRMKIQTDDNGHVRVKTAEKEPGKPWDVKIEEYNMGDNEIGGEQEQQKSILNENMKIEQA